jgi:hypothetical protein
MEVGKREEVMLSALNPKNARNRVLQHRKHEGDSKVIHDGPISGLQSTFLDLQKKIDITRMSR